MIDYSVFVGSVLFFYEFELYSSCVKIRGCWWLLIGVKGVSRVSIFNGGFSGGCILFSGVFMAQGHACIQ